MENKGLLVIQYRLNVNETLYNKNMTVLAVGDRKTDVKWGLLHRYELFSDYLTLVLKVKTMKKHIYHQRSQHQRVYHELYEPSQPCCVNDYSLENFQASVEVVCTASKRKGIKIKKLCLLDRFKKSEKKHCLKLLIRNLI